MYWLYNGPQDSVFEPGTEEEANLVQQYQNAAQDILGKSEAGKISGLPAEPNMDNGITAGGNMLRHLLQCTDNLVEYLSFELTEYDNVATIQFKKTTR